jgi:hypothetical protein
MSQGENVLKELDAVEASAVLQGGPGRTSDAATVSPITVLNPSTGSITMASAPRQLEAHQHKASSSAMRNERPPVESPSNSIGRTDSFGTVCALK